MNPFSLDARTGFRALTQGFDLPLIDILQWCGLHWSVLPRRPSHLPCYGCFTSLLQQVCLCARRKIQFCNSWNLNCAGLLSSGLLLLLITTTLLKGRNFSTTSNVSISKYRPVPPRRHSKNSAQSENDTICSILLLLQTSSPAADQKLLTYQALRISNDIYGYDVLRLRDGQRFR